jgi:hypothetical protein
MINKEAYQKIVKEFSVAKIQLVAVSKTKPVEDIKDFYDLGHRDFGENYVQELVDKQTRLPDDVRWHFIGHLQTNKVKYIAPFVHLIQSVDSVRLLQEINKQAVKHDREIKCLLQVHVAEEETKFGFDEQELQELSGLAELQHVRICGIMGMATLTEDENKIRREFRKLKTIFDKNALVQSQQFKFETLSMGMSSDYKIAVEEGSNMVRIGSMLFGQRLVDPKPLTFL